MFLLLHAAVRSRLTGLRAASTFLVRVSSINGRDTNILSLLALFWGSAFLSAFCFCLCAWRVTPNSQREGYPLERNSSFTFSVLRLALRGSDETLGARRYCDLATAFFSLKGYAESKERLIGAASGLMYVQFGCEMTTWVDSDQRPNSEFWNSGNFGRMFVQCCCFLIANNPRVCSERWCII